MAIPRQVNMGYIFKAKLLSFVERLKAPKSGIWILFY